MDTNRKDYLKGRPLAEGEYTYAPNPISITTITPEQKDWVEKRNKAIGIFNVTGDRTMADELGIPLPERPRNNLP